MYDHKYQVYEYGKHAMPSKHIEDGLWRKVERRTVDAIVETRMPIKETTMLKWVIQAGLLALKDCEYKTDPETGAVMPPKKLLENQE